ncbi:MAG TPA: neutral/alkaline non-lysosomal ceramidase N-terminal domain-containing protein [Candidatus Brocadiia bacterium]|nr:neutral/alkaline non-lysosomal ceramidase N-terminal domain-containing protein [Candidatus Brocadiia bacterium]
MMIPLLFFSASCISHPDRNSPGGIAASNAKPAGPALFIGVAHVDMTPEGPVPLAGYGARYPKLSEGIHDRVFARCVVIRSGETTLALVSCDFRGMSAPLGRDIAKIAAESGCPVPADNIMIAGTHTHGGPGGYLNHPLWAIVAGNYQQKIYDKLRDSIARCIIEASRELRPVKMAAGSVMIEGFNRNRRGEESVDRSLNIIRFDGEDGRPLAIIVNFTGHPTIIDGDDMLMTREWPGALVDGVMEHYGGAECLFFNGAEGDQSGCINEGKFADRYEKAAAMGKALSVKAIELCDTLRPGPNPVVKITRREIELPDSVAAGTKLLPKSCVWHRIELGGVWLMTIPGEAVCDIGLMLKDRARKAGCELPIVVGLANDHLGYFVTPEQYCKGGYEATMNFYGPEIRNTHARALLGDIAPDAGITPEKNLLEGAELVRSDGAPLLRLSGDPFQMGFQHGRLLRNEIRELLALWEPEIAKSLRPSYQKLIWKQPTAAVVVNAIGGFEVVAMPAFGFASRALFPNTPPEIYDEMRGIAEGAGVHFDRILSLNAALTLLSQKDLTRVGESISLCASIVRITKNGANPVIHARALDSAWPKLFASRIIVIEYSPKNGRRFLSVAWPGMAGVLTAVNDAGLSVSVESAGDRSEATLKNVPISFTCRLLAQHDSDLEAAVERLKTSLPEAGFHVTLADGRGRRAICADLCPETSAMREPEDGWLPGAIITDTAEPYVGKRFKGPGLTAVNEAERTRYEALLLAIKSGNPALESAEGWESMLRDKGSGICVERTICACVMLPGIGEIRLRRTGIEEETGFRTYRLIAR